MFEGQKTPRVFGVPLGADFPEALVDGVQQHTQDWPPHEIARLEIIVNTRRMARRVQALFDQGPALLVPRIRLLTDLANARYTSDAPAISPLRRRLEISQLVASLLERQPDLAPRAALYDLSDSLAGLMDEMNGEGVSADAIESLDVSDQSGHWKRTLGFLGIVRHFAENMDDAPDRETLQRRSIEALIDQWRTSPPDHPILLAGSTGSRGPTLLLMQAIACLPKGAVILPGFDFDMPAQVWDQLDSTTSAEDHPQYRFRLLADRLEIQPDDIAPWGRLKTPNVARNQLVSLALRPAPVTDSWLAEGPKLTGIKDATRNMTLVEASSAREEALVIALRLRKAVEQGKTAALITPDRMLTRQVSASLDRWDILPDDSAGTPLQLSPPGRFLRHISSLFLRKLTSEDLLTLLKHPLTHTGADRGPHLRLTRELELHLRRNGPPFPDADSLRSWASAQKDQAAASWADWVVQAFMGRYDPQPKPLLARIEAHIEIAQTIARGLTAEGSGGLWQEKAGREARELIDNLIQEAPHGGDLDASDYADLFGAILATGEVRDRDAPHNQVLIWGTLEARVQGADILILGGLNEGSWPEAPAPDPWLNRKMRRDAGLLSPERRIGLSAHDFQQAISTQEVMLTRAIRSEDAETVPSRWLNRISNLLDGLHENGGPDALKNMRARGTDWLAMARKLEQPKPIPGAKRPSPVPPIESRPRKLSVTEIKRLIRDPYAIYAKHTLRVRPLNPLMKVPDALLRGTVIHDILERFVHEVTQKEIPLNRRAFLEISETILAENVPWPETRALWRARLERIAEQFIPDEVARQEHAQPVAFEASGKIDMKSPDFTLTTKADRIDMNERGALLIYDYKTGKPPTAAEQRHFDKQLLLETVIAERSGFGKLAPCPVASATFIGLGNPPVTVDAPLQDTPIDVVWDEFQKLIAAYFEPTQGFTARRTMFKDSDISDYDQLSRFGEWDVTVDPTPERLR